MQNIESNTESAKISAEFLDFESILFDNLRFLGFDEKSQDLHLGPGLFNRSNPSAGDKIIYFLFSKLRPRQYEKVLTITFLCMLIFFNCTS